MANPTNLYSYQGQEPQPLPNEIGWDDGIYQSRTGVESFTKENLKKAGYTGPYAYPEINIDHQRVYWDSKKLKYVVEDIPDEELWDRIRTERNRRLSECDWTMAVDIPEVVNQREWELHRQRLRDITLEYTNPREVVWPTSPEGRPDDDFDQERVIEEKLRWRVKYLETYVRQLFNDVEILKSKLVEGK